MSDEKGQSRTKDELLMELIRTREKLARLSPFKKGLGPEDLESETTPELPLSVLFSLSDLIILADRASRFVYVCPTVENVLGYSVEEALSMGKVGALLGEDLFDPDRLNREGEIHNIERRIANKQGETRVFLISVRKVSLKNGSILYSCRDITDKAEAEEKLRRSEERYRLLAENSLLGVYIHQDDHFVYSNRRLREMLEYSADELESMPVWSIFPTEEQPDMKSMVRAQYEGRRQPVSFETRVTIKSDETKWVEMSAVSTSFADKPAVLGTMADITQRKQAEERLRASLEEREVLLREVHHRVKNNLAIISSFMAFQARSPDTDSVEEAFEEVQLRIRSMAIAHEILVQSERLAVLNVRSYVETLVFEIIRRFGEPGLGKHVKTEIAGVSLHIDTAVTLGFLITELLITAGKSSRRVKVERRIALTLRADGTEGCELVVFDSAGAIMNNIDGDEASSTGRQLVEVFVDQLNGAIETDDSQPESLTVRFPCELYDIDSAG